MINVKEVRKHFPILEVPINGKRLCYLDSAATTLKPEPVVKRIAEHYLYESSNVHRGIHTLSDRATQFFEEARQKVAHFINAEEGEIVFTKGTTESINVIANSFLFGGLSKGDEILITEMEHHSNLVPWQNLAEKTGATLVFVSVNSQGELVDLTQKLNKKTKILSLTALSNTLGTENDIKAIVSQAKAFGALTVVDAAQAVANRKVDVRSWGADFVAFSSHKLFGPTGVGVLYGRRERLEALHPLLFGGAMIDKVTFEKTTYLSAPFRFEAGTPHIAGVIGLGTAVDFVESIGREKIEQHESQLLAYATEELKKIRQIHLFGEAQKKGPIISFNIEGQHHQDVGAILDREGVAVRTGHHCTQPLLSKFNLTGTVRASFSVYSDQQDIDQFIAAIKKTITLLSE